jgi:hypothetical protein
MFQIRDRVAWTVTAVVALLSCSSAGPATAQSEERVAGWRSDLQFAETQFLPADRSFDEAARDAFRREVATLRDSVAHLSDAEIAVRLARVTASSGNAHTRAYLLRNRAYLRRYPIRVWWFEDGLYVVRTRPGLERLIGSRVTEIAGRPLEEVVRRAGDLYAGNGGWRRYMTTYTLTSPDALLGLGLNEGHGTATWTLELDGETVRERIEPLPLDRFDDPTEAWWDLAPTHEDRTGPWVSGLPADTSRLPLYLRQPERRYWHAYLPERDALYLQYNRAGDMPGGETVAEFEARFLAELRERSPSKVIVDLRFNTGGNLLAAEDLFDSILEETRSLGPGGLVVITGPATFSAGLFHALQMAGSPAVRFIGEWPGDDFDFWAEGGNVPLPFSGLTLHYADRFHSNTPEPVAPDTPVIIDQSAGGLSPWESVSIASEDYFGLRDPVMDAALGN